MYATIGDKKIFYRMTGQGRPLLVLHGGLGMDHRYLFKWMAELSVNYKVIFIDIPGNGLSTKFLKDESFSIELLVDLIESFRKKIIKMPIMLLGHSYGGLLSIIYMIRYPKSLQKVVLVSTPADVDFQDKNEIAEAKLKLTKKSQKIINNPIKTNEDFKLFMEHLSPLYFYQKEYISAFLSANKSKYTHSMLVRGHKEVKKLETYKKQFHEINVQTLILHGQKDIIVPFRAIKHLRRHKSVFKVKMFHKSGHFPFIEEKDRFFKEVKLFLK